MKKLLFPLVALLLLVLVQPVSATEELNRPIWPAAMESVTEGEDLVDAVGDAAMASYMLSRKTARRNSFRGWCGLMTSHQLYNLGINEKLIVTDGNGQYDYYQGMDMTTGGYYVNAYDSNEYTLEEALNTITDYGNKDAFNILVGFQWTHTAEGSLYGHSVVINGIVDGYVYFVESYDSSLGPQGGLLTCTIKEFARYYKSWTLFEGVIHFGDGVYSNVCPTTSTDLMIQARFDTILRSQPSLLGKKGAEHVRDVCAGETFRAIALCRDTWGDYYKVMTNEGFAFISVNAVSLLSAGDGDMSLTELQLPERLQPGQDLTIDGKVTASYGRVASLELSIYGLDGTPLRKESAEIDEPEGQLSVLNGKLYADLLESGVYRAEVYAYSVAPVAGDQWGKSRYQRVLLHSQYLVVGDAPIPEESKTAERQGQLLPEGWFRSQGVDYYVQNGSLVTGWQTIDEKQYYFSATGALCKGWLTIGGRTWYRLPDGTGAVGQLQLDGTTWMFGASGMLLGKANTAEADT